VSTVAPIGDPAAVAAAAGAAGRGELVVVPTDTVYGLAASVDRPEAVAAIFVAKGRAPEVALPVLVGAVDDARAVARFDDGAEALAAAFWPGPLTIVLPRAPGLTADLGGDGATVGIRVPAHGPLRRLLAATGPLATTSANRSGEPTPATVDGVEAVFGEAVSVYLDGGPASGGPASTVVSLQAGTPTVLREGAISLDDLRRALRP